MISFDLRNALAVIERNVIAIRKLNTFAHYSIGIGMIVVVFNENKRDSSVMHDKFSWDFLQSHVSRFKKKNVLDTSLFFCFL